MSEGRAVLLKAISEEAFSQHVAELARRGGWCGVHIRKSLTTGRGFSVLQGVHTLRNSDHEDGRGFPDWLFAKPGQPLLLPELKTVTGRTSKDQDRWLSLLATVTAIQVGLWRPTDEEAIKFALNATSGGQPTVQAGE